MDYELDTIKGNEESRIFRTAVAEKAGAAIHRETHYVG